MTVFVSFRYEVNSKTSLNKNSVNKSWNIIYWFKMSLKLPKPPESDQNVRLMGGRLTTEMTSAIKRQEQISRSDYWKSGFSGLGLINAASGLHKRPSYCTLGHVNVDYIFPELFLPSAISVHHQKLRERARLAPMILFSRSRTTLGSAVAKGSDTSSLSPRRIAVPKSTCLQLKEPELPSHDSSLSDVFSPTNSRYVDAFDATNDDTCSIEEEKELVTNPDNRAQEKAKDESLEQSIKTNKSKGKRSNSFPFLKYRTLEPYDSKQKNESTRRYIPSPTAVVVTKVLTDRQAKPILKKSDTQSMHFTGNKVLDRSNTVSILASQQTQSTQTNDLFSKSSGYGSHTEHRDLKFKRPREYTVPVIYSDTGMRPELRPGSRKRSVKFNSDNKIHEYVPHDPICS